ncbi:SIS domain-containing protein [Streptomyces sp. A7024]|uniref:SIS domain-containing protein n=1 Tax=Streptomyces coryli TaxID=1128680 RepID=A0A6G4UBB0_9ACTN|nr:SIS domain-containing protein [Streptomyces coryli]NGN69000.1 SIS domain-containing protein [Streptomyces coryli]
MTSAEATRRHHADHVRTLLDDLDAAAPQQVTAAAEVLLDCIADGGVIHAAGAGHSLAMVCEMFYRAGGLACVRPVWDPEVFPLPNAIGSTAVEREPGRGRAVVERAAPAAPDVMVVFSTSGRNPYPVEIAQEALARGLKVIAVTSLEASAKASDRSGTRLADHATVVLDNRVPPGDVVHPPQQPRTAAVSTVLAAYLWSQVLVEVDALATARGVELPRWVSANVPGGDEANKALLERYGPRIPELGAGA